MKSEPGDDVARYVRAKRLQYAQEILPKTKIYLDTKYWISFRDVRFGRPTSAAMASLLATLEGLVRDGKAVCPVNADVYFEVFKQRDPATLTATIQLLDDLSAGACLLPLLERAQLEIAHFMKSAVKGPSAVYELRELVWTRPAYLVGFATPYNHRLSRALNKKIGTKLVDYLWDRKHIDLLNAMGVDEGVNRLGSFNDISSELNKGKNENLNAHTTFKSMFLSEVAGVLDAWSPTIADYISHMSQELASSQQQLGRDELMAAARQFAHVIHEGFRRNKIAGAFPSIRIGAGLHAAVRWDRKRKYKANDLPDFRHAEAAIPYCDYFFTERPLQSLLRDRNLRLSNYFKCEVLSDPADALSKIA